MHLEASILGLKIRAPTALTADIDTRTGLWVGQGFSGTAVTEIQRRPLKIVGEDRTTMVFTLGSGKASALPAKLHKLGWQPAGEDTNNHRDAVNGFSLDVPKTFKQAEVPPGRDFLGRFVHTSGMEMLVTSGDKGPPLDLQEVVDQFAAIMEEGYKLADETRLVLPGNVPGVLMAITYGNGKVTVLTIMAVDGSRIVTVSSGAPTSMKQHLAELRTTLMTLRVFKPDYTKARPG
ncbi:MAG: hypothetical protein ACYTF6_14200, partial [Planctomycetota bacterium]|jgi:hypothetical protein